MNSIDIFPWDEHFNTGIEKIDSQHRKLVEILNRLATMVAYQSSEEDLSKIFDELMEYTIYHFQTEEAIWHQHIDQIALRDEHEKVHQKFIDTILDLKKQLEQKTLRELADEALKFLAQWLASHILESDRYMAYITFALDDGLDIESAKNRAEEQMSGSSRILIKIIISIYQTLSKNTLHLMREIQTHSSYEHKLIHEEKYRNLLLELSTSFINLPIGKMDHTIENALGKMATFTSTDRAYIFDYDVDKETTSNLFEWCAQGIAPQIDDLQDIPLSVIEDWFIRHSKGEHIIIEDVQKLPNGNMRDILLPQKIKSLAAFPLLSNKQCIGFVGFDAVKDYHQFTESEVSLLRLFSELLVNVTQKKQTQEDLYHERSFLKTLIQAIPDLVWMKDPDGVYITCNGRFEEFFGAKESEIVGKTDYDFVEKSLADFFRLHDKKVMQSGKANVNEEDVPFASDGHIESLHTTKVPIYDVNNELLGVLGVGRNITDIKKAQKKLEEKEHYQRALLDNFPFLVWLKDEKSRFLAVNQPFADTCNIESTDEFIGKTDLDVWPKDLAKAYQKDDEEVIASGKPKNVEESLQDKDKRIWIETYKSPVTLDGDVIGTVGYARDITERKDAQEQLKLAANVFTHSREGIVITSADNKIVKVNDSVQRISGYSKEELLGKNPAVFSSGKQSKQFYTSMWKELHIKGFWTGEISNRHKNGNVYIEMITITVVKDSEGNILNYLALFTDITSTKEQQKRLEYIAHYDALTGLPNRVLFSDRLHQSIALTQRNKNKLAVVYLDLDGFKEINDQFGHEYGDVLLSAVADKMKHVTRDEDTIARIGGDEFVAVLLNIEKNEDCIPMIQRLLTAVSEPVSHNDVVMGVSASIGVSFFDYRDDVDADQLIRYADQAMYQAKLSGKNRFHIFDSKQDESIRIQYQKVESIQTALENNEFVLYYQPKVNMKTSTVHGVEALIRWNHPEQGIMPPGKFLPIIDGHILQIKIGEWVLEEAVKHIEFWKERGLNLLVGVNIDAIHLLQGNIVVYIKNLLKKYPTVHYQDIKLEILETSALEDITHVIKIMQECRELGIEFSLDDFGTGYSSLTYLKRLPVSELKIDQSFVHDMLIDTDDLAILEGIINLSTTFQQNVIAEGVEEIEHGEVLIQMGCENAQGYAIAKPMPMNHVMDWIKKFKSDTRWVNAELQSRDAISVLYAIIEHNAWMEKFIAFTQAKLLFITEDNHIQCKLNHWINILKKHKKGLNLVELDTLHQDLHEKANYVIRDKKQGLDILENSINDIKLIHKKILAILNTLKSQLS